MKNKSLYHWLVAVCCAIIIMVAVGMVVNCAGLFYTAVADDLGIRRGDVALYGTIVSLLGGFFSPAVAKLMTKMNFTLMLTVGLVMECVCYGALSFCSEIWMFYILAVFIGTGFCLCTSMPLLMVVNNWFEQMNGLVTGIVMASTGIGGAIFTQILNALISNLGWRASYRTGAVIALVLALPGILFVIRLTPEEKGYLPYGASMSRSAYSANITGTEKKEKIISVPLITLIIAAIASACVTALNSHFSGYATEIGAGVAMGAMMMTGCSVGNIVSKLLFGILSDRIGPYITVVAFGTITAVDLFIIGISSFNNPVVLFTLGFLYGASFAYCSVAIPLIVRKIFGPERYARAFSIVNIFTNGGFAVFLSVIGYIYDFTGTYRISVFICLAFTIISVVFVFVAAASGRKKFYR